jgi:ParB family chromosome partitioning protein
MTIKKTVLGRGLGALIEEAHQIPREVAQAIEATNEIDLSKIEMNPFQPRKDFDEDALEELATSIRHLGVVQPITVRKIDYDHFQLIAGERRVRAAMRAGLDRIPAFVRSADDQGMLEMALVENLNRTDLNSVEIAMSFNRLLEECNLTQEVLSERVGKKRSTVANYLRLLKLPPEVQLGLRQDKISMGHARALSGINNIFKQIELYNKIVSDDLSVRAVEELVREINEPISSEPVDERNAEEKLSDVRKKEAVSDEYNELRKHLSKRFDTTIEFKRNNKGAGKIVISFRSDDDLERILTLLDARNV